MDNTSNHLDNSNSVTPHVGSDYVSVEQCPLKTYHGRTHYTYELNSPVEDWEEVPRTHISYIHVEWKIMISCNRADFLFVLLSSVKTKAMLFSPVRYFWPSSRRVAARRVAPQSMSFDFIFATRISTFSRNNVVYPFRNSP